MLSKSVFLKYLNIASDRVDATKVFAVVILRQRNSKLG